MLSKIKGLFNKANKGTYLALLFMIVFIFSGDVAFAEETTVMSSLNVVFLMISMLVGFFSSIIGLLIDPAWTSGSAFGLSAKFKEIWILVSNVVYFIFAFILVWIAFMNIIGKEGTEYELKQALPKFIVGILIVPFSWFFVNFVISISAILTTSVIALPHDMFKDTYTKIEGKFYHNYVIDYPSEITDGKDKGKYKGGGYSHGTESTEVKTLNFDSIGSIMMVYTYGIFKVDGIDQLKKNDIKSGIKAIIDIIMKMGFNILFLIVYCILIIAIGIALIVRGIYLWLFLIFSPVFGLLHFFASDKGGDGALKNFNIKEFISLAMVPVYVAAALSFGLMFIFTVIGSTNLNKPIGLSNNGFIEFKPDGTLITNNGTIETSFKLPSNILDGKIADSSGVDVAADGVGGLFVRLLSIIIFWMAVMAALKSSEITGAAIQPIADFGNSVGKLIQNAPQYIPIAPNGQSIGSMAQGAQGVMNTSFGKGHMSTKASDFQTMLGGKTVQSEAKRIADNIRKDQGVASINNKPSYEKGVLHKGITDFNKASPKGFNDMAKTEREAVFDAFLPKAGLDMKKIKESSYYRTATTKGQKLDDNLFYKMLAEGSDDGKFNKEVSDSMMNDFQSSKGTTGNTNTPDPTKNAVHEVKDSTNLKDIVANPSKKASITKVKFAGNTDETNEIFIDNSGNLGKITITDGSQGLSIDLEKTKIDDIIGNSNDIKLIKDLMSKTGITIDSDKEKLLESIFSIDNAKAKVLLAKIK